MKNKLLVLGAMVCLIAILAAGTLAYFTTNAVTHTVITTGEIDISIVEKVPDGTPRYDEEGKLLGYTIEDIMPDKTVTKDVKIHNDTIEPAWIRVKLIHTIKNKAGDTQPNTLNGVEMVQYNVPEANASKWVKDGDWYYYTEPLAGGADTASLIETVHFAAEMDNRYQDCTIELSVEAEAVQSKNNPIPEGKDVTDIPGWPTT